MSRTPAALTLLALAACGAPQLEYSPDPDSTPSEPEVTYTPVDAVQLSATDFTLPVNVGTLTAADLDGDGLAELFGASDDAELWAFSGFVDDALQSTLLADRSDLERWTLQAGGDLALEWQFTLAAVPVDMNLDGVDELLLSVQGMGVYGSTHLATGLVHDPMGSARFEPLYVSDGHHAAFPVADLDGDGLPELTVSDRDSAFVMTSSGRTLGLPQVANYTMYPNAAVVERDGRRELVLFINYGYGISEYVVVGTDGQGGLGEPMVDYSPFGYDAHFGVAPGRTAREALLHSGDGVWQLQGDTLTQLVDGDDAGLWQTRFGDLDGDGWLDMLTLDLNSEVQLLASDGQGGHADMDYQGPSPDYNDQLVDLNADHLAEVVKQSWNQDTQEWDLRVWWNVSR